MIDNIIIERDRDLQANVKVAQLALDKHRWANCADPNGPKHTYEEYAKAVGVNKSTISRSVSAYTASVAERNNLDVSTRNNSGNNSQPGRPRDAATTAVADAITEGKDLDDPTDEQHAKTRRARTGTTGTRRKTTGTPAGSSKAAPGKTELPNVPLGQPRDAYMNTMEEMLDTMMEYAGIAAANRLQAGILNQMELERVGKKIAAIRDFLAVIDKQQQAAAS